MTDTKTLAPTDPRSLFAAAVRTGTEVVANVKPAQFADPTPCAEMNVEHLLGHLVAVLRRTAHVGRGGNVIEVPEHVVDVAEDGWVDAWTSAAHDIQEVFTDDAQLTRMFTLPWATLPGAALLGMYTNEITCHTWDLAQATGQRPQFDDAAVDFAFGVMRQALPAEGRMASFEAAWANMPEEVRRGMQPPFAEAVQVPAGAPLIDQLVAWNGRRPA